MRVLAERWKEALHLAFGPESQLAVAYSSGLVVWDASTGGQVARFRYSSAPPAPTRVSDILFPVDGRAVYIISMHRGLLGYRLPDFTPEPVDQPSSRRPDAASVSPCGRWLVCQMFGSPGWQGATGNVGFVGYRRDGDAPPAFDWLNAVGHHYATGTAIFPGGDRFATVEYPLRSGLPELNLVPQVTVRAWVSGNVLASAPCNYWDANQVALSPDGGRVVVRAGTLLLSWPASLVGEPVRAVNNSPKHFTRIAFHPSGQFLAATSNDATVKLFDAATLALVRTFTWNIGKLKAVAFSADGTLAAAAGEAGRVIVWDVDL